MSNARVHIVGTGLLTPLGTDTEQSAASIAAGLSAFDETAIMDRAFQPFVMSSLPEDCLAELKESLDLIPGLTHRELRMLRLASPALLEAAACIADQQTPPPLFLGLPETATKVKLDPDKFLKNLHTQSDSCFDLNSSHAVLEGRSSGVKAIHLACNAIRSGKTGIAIAGGVDTFRDLYILALMDSEKRINSALTMDGFVPGEGAGFVLLADPDFAKTAGLRKLASVIATAEGNEPGHLYSKEPYRGEGLAKTIQDLLRDSSVDSPVSTVYSSMNGENHFAKEWGVSYIRSSTKIAEDYRIEHPADCIGDTGAACGPIMVALAATGFKNNNLKSSALVYASSDTAARSACLLSAE